MNRQNGQELFEISQRNYNASGQNLRHDARVGAVLVSLGMHRNMLKLIMNKSHTFDYQPLEKENDCAI